LENISAPAADKLPQSLKELAYRQAHAVHPPPYFDKDIDELIRKIREQDKLRLALGATTSQAEVADMLVSQARQLRFLVRLLFCFGIALVLLIGIVANGFGGKDVRSVANSVTICGGFVAYFSVRYFEKVALKRLKRVIAAAGLDSEARAVLIGRLQALRNGNSMLDHCVNELIIALK
jgi:hypothetical protein